LLTSTARSCGGRAMMLRCDGWPASVPACLQARARRHCLEAAELALSFRAIAGLDQEQEPGCAGREAGSRRGLGSVTSGRRGQFENQTAIQKYADAHDLEYVWEGMKAFAKRWRLAQLAQPGTYELVEVRTKRGVTRALLFPKAILRAEFEAAAPMRHARAKKKKLWRASLIRKRSRYLGFMSNQILGYVDAPDRESAEAAAVSAFSLTEEQRKRLVVQQQEQRKRLVLQEHG